MPVLEYLNIHVLKEKRCYFVVCPHDLLAVAFFFAMENTMKPLLHIAVCMNL